MESVRACPSASRGVCVCRVSRPASLASRRVTYQLLRRSCLGVGTGGGARLVGTSRRWTWATATRRRRATSATWISNAARASSGSSWCRCFTRRRATAPRRPAALLSHPKPRLSWQCGPVVNVHVPKDKLTQQHMGFGFVEFRSEDDAQYAIKVSRASRPARQSGCRGERAEVRARTPARAKSRAAAASPRGAARALQVLNMIKIFGKPIRVNAVCTPLPRACGRTTARREGRPRAAVRTSR